MITQNEAPSIFLVIHPRRPPTTGRCHGLPSTPTNRGLRKAVHTQPLLARPARRAGRAGFDDYLCRAAGAAGTAVVHIRLQVDTQPAARCEPSCASGGRWWRRRTDSSRSRSWSRGRGWGWSWCWCWCRSGSWRRRRRLHLGGTCRWRRGCRSRGWLRSSRTRRRGRSGGRRCRRRRGGGPRNGDRASHAERRAVAGDRTSVCKRPRRTERVGKRSTSGKHPRIKPSRHEIASAAGLGHGVGGAGPNHCPHHGISYCYGHSVRRIREPPRAGLDVDGCRKGEVCEGGKSEKKKE